MIQGVQVPIDKEFLDHGRTPRLWDGTRVPAGLRARLSHVWAQLRQVESQLRHQRRRAARPPDIATPTGRAIAQLQTLRAVGVTGAWVLATEIFGWRQIQKGTINNSVLWRFHSRIRLLRTRELLIPRRVAWPIEKAADQPQPVVSNNSIGASEGSVSSKAASLVKSQPQLDPIRGFDRSPFEHYVSARERQRPRFQRLPAVARPHCHRLVGSRLDSLTAGHSSEVVLSRRRWRSRRLP